MVLLKQMKQNLNHMIKKVFNISLEKRDENKVKYNKEFSKEKRRK